MNYARLHGDTVAEIITVEDSANIRDLFHPDIADLFKQCAKNVAVGWTYKDEKFSEPGTPSLSETKAALKANVDASAENQRLKYITSGAGQALTYMQKSDEARRFLAGENPDSTDYPLLAAEVGITAADIEGVAIIVAAAYGQWQQIGAAIEAIRLGSKAAIDAAESIEAAQDVYEAIAWPSGQP